MQPFEDHATCVTGRGLSHHTTAQRAGACPPRVRGTCVTAHLACNLGRAAGSVGSSCTLSTLLLCGPTRHHLVAGWVGVNQGKQLLPEKQISMDKDTLQPGLCALACISLWQGNTSPLSGSGKWLTSVGNCLPVLSTNLNQLDGSIVL